MRDFRDAKAMANTLRTNLAAEGIKLTVSQSLELIAKAFGMADWNTLSAAINAAAETPAAERPITSERVGFSAGMELTLQRAAADASRRHHGHTTLEHLLLALIDDGDASAVLTGCRVDVDALRQALSDYLADYLDSEPRQPAAAAPRPSPGFQRVIQRAVIHVQASGRQSVTAAQVLVAIFSEPESQAAHFLAAQAMTRIDAVNFIAHGIVKGGGNAVA